tara:strand:- start:4953 stop:5195 length:243 start_codon:yes stop_codon:yes gene_type:complete
MIYKRKLEDWSEEIAELEAFFCTVNFPKEPIKLSEGTTILDCKRFIDNHLGIVRVNAGKIRFKPYLQRLQTLKNVLCLKY